LEKDYRKGKFKIYVNGKHFTTFENVEEISLNVIGSISSHISGWLNQVGQLFPCFALINLQPML